MDGRGRSKDINFKSSEESYYFFISACWLCFPSICMFLYHGEVVD